MALTFPPATFFGMPLGLLDLGLAWRGATHLWNLPPAIADLILGFGGLLWVLLAALYVSKWIYARSEAFAEFEHPVMCCFVGLRRSPPLMAAIAVLPYLRPIA